MRRASLPNDVELEYETIGDPADPTLLLVMGLGAQLITWDDRFCERLAAGGRHIVRFDNRDAGLSTHLDGPQVDPVAVLRASTSGAPLPAVPYTLSDLAADAIGLLDHLGIGRAHVAGASMGGMIVQVLAIEHPERLISVTSIMSTCGDWAYGAPSAAAGAMLFAPPPAGRDEAIARAAASRAVSSKRYFDAVDAEHRAARAFDRAFDPQGTARQLAAIYATGDRSELLRSVTVPTLVIHGLDDELIDPSGGRRTAELIPGAHLLELADMGHDLPEPLWPLIVSAILAHGDIAAGTTAPGTTTPGTTTSATTASTGATERPHTAGASS